MHRTSVSFAVGTAFLAATFAVAGESGVHESAWAQVDLTSPLPADLTDPEGKTRWDLSGVTLGTRWTRIVRSEGASAGLQARWIEERPHRGLGPTVTAVVGDPTGQGQVERWLMPERDPDLWRPAIGFSVELETEGPRGTEREWIRVERAGLGWLFLPSGPREVVLQRAVALGRDGEGQLQPVELIHRWVDPRAGLVAEVRGPVTPDGRTRTRIESAAVVERIEQEALNLKLYIDAVDRPLRARIRFGWDRGLGTSISSLTPGAHSTMADLVAAGAWDFSGNNQTSYPSMEQVSSLMVELSADQASAFGQCGFTANAARKVSREDRIDASNVPDNTLTVTERLDGVTTAGNVLLVASHRHEELGGVGVEGEARICHDSSTGRTAVPLWSFANQDANGWFADIGDTWQSDPPFNCQQIIWTNAIISDRLWAKSGTNASLGTLSGRQQGQIVAEGPVTLPSGHTFNALVARTWVEYNLFTGSSCLFATQGVRTVIHLWEVPFVGTVIRLQSGNSAPTVDGFTSVDETDIKFGLFPPRAITVGDTTASTVEISWDPGSILGEIDRYKVYWDVDSGASTPYAFNSDTHPGQVSFAGTSAVISGLTPGVPYFLTVTSVRDYCEPGLCANNDCAPSCAEPDPNPCPGVSCSVVTPLESLIFPTQVAGGTTPIPAEVGATPGGSCVPTLEVMGVTFDKADGSCRICWTPTADPCVEGYQILGASSPATDIDFSAIVPDTGLTNCWTFDSTDSFFLVVGASPAGTGPWGHFGH